MRKNVVAKADIRGTASGVMFMAFFGTVWADIGIGGLRTSNAIWLLILVVLIGATLFYLGIRMIRRSRNLTYSGQSRNTKNINKWFNIIFVTEFGLIATVAIITNVIERFDLFFPIMAIIVGLHFFPLAHLFQVNVYYLTGALLCLLAIVTLLFVPLEINIAGHRIDAWWTFLGLGSMLILWITSLVILTMGYKLLRIAQNHK